MPHRAKLWGGLFFVLFAAFLIARAPLTAIAPFVFARSDVVDYVAAEGTVWNGRLIGVRFGDIDLGDVGVRAEAARAVAGALGARISVDGPAIRAQAQIRRRLDGRIAARDARLHLDLANLPLVAPDGRRLVGALAARAARIEAAPGLGCLRAEGVELWTDALARTFAAYDWTGPALDGIGGCREDGAFEFTLEGVSETERVTASAAASADLSYELTGIVMTTDERLKAILPALGFEARGEDHVYTDRGRLSAP